MRDEILSTLLKMSDRQYDKEAKKRTRDIIGLPDDEAKKPLSQLLDLCVYCSWCSGFEITVLNVLVEQLNITDEEKEGYRKELKKEMGI